MEPSGESHDEIEEDDKKETPFEPQDELEDILKEQGIEVKEHYKE